MQLSLPSPAWWLLVIKPNRSHYRFSDGDDVGNLESEPQLDTLCLACILGLGPETKSSRMARSSMHPCPRLPSEIDPCNPGT